MEPSFVVNGCIVFVRELSVEDGSATGPMGVVGKTFCILLLVELFMLLLADPTTE